jgi:hypothetical protein
VTYTAPSHEGAENIPTRLKSKLPHTLSYPVGAKLISEFLAGVPQYAGLALDFYFDRKQLVFHGAAEYEVIRAGFASHVWGLEGSIWARPWVITVSPVPRPLRHQVLARIEAEALPAIRAWLCANNHSAERDGGHSLHFTYDPLKDELKRHEDASLEWKTQLAD